jgi:hypothetical protein
MCCISGFTEERVVSQSLCLKKHARTGADGGVGFPAFFPGHFGTSKEALPLPKDPKPRNGKLLCCL